MFELTYEDHGAWLGNDEELSPTSLFAVSTTHFQLDAGDNPRADRWVTRYLPVTRMPSSAYSHLWSAGPGNVQRGFVLGTSLLHDQQDGIPLLRFRLVH
ncbi:hypothetical protein O9929_19480 [Vibrio lentus]|nr:hypothetical protein [Vibrio lentus]